MRRLRLLLSSLVALALAASCTDTPTAPDASGARPLLDMSAAAAADPVSFCNPAQIIIPDPQPFIPAPIPVPSTIDVSGIGSDPFKVTVTLRGFTHPIGNDVDILIVGPTGVKVMLVSDAGQATNNVTLTLDDNASSSLPPGGPILSGTYKPTNFGGGDAIPGGNPPGPYGSLLSGFAGTDPNGTWKLYVWDDTPAASGSISAGWCVNITTLTVPVANAGGPYTVVEGSPITFDGTGSADAGNDIMSYAWNFGDGTTGTGPTPQHTYENMGSYTVTLVVTDAAGATDDATTSVTVLNVPGTAESFCNPAPITIRDANAALPYPSTVTVANAITGPFKITVTVKGINHTILFDLDMLLAGPAGQTVMLMSDADGGADLQNATLTFDDASSPIPATPGAILPSGSYKPTNIGSPDAMPAGAPAEPYGSSLGVFLGTDPNGTWRLLLRDDVLGGGNGSVTGGWCVNIVPTNAAPVANAGGPYSGAEGSPITFDGTGSTDPDNDIVSYAWDFGDGESGSGATVEHTYANSGTYTVTLVVTDDDGAPDDATALVTVADVAPTATFNAPREVSEGSVATISLTSPSAADARFAFDCGSGYGAIGTASSDGCPAGDNGPMTVKGRVIDATIDDLFSEFTAEINVTNVAPTATFAHNGPVSEGTPIQLQLMNPIDVAADLAAGLTYAFDCGSGYGATSAASNASCLTTDNGDVQVKGKVIDKDGGEREYSAIVSVTNVAPVVTSLVLPSGPVAVNTPVTLGAAFSDVGTDRKSVV